MRPAFHAFPHPPNHCVSPSRLVIPLSVICSSSRFVPYHRVLFTLLFPRYTLAHIALMMEVERAEKVIQQEQQLALYRAEGRTKPLPRPS